VELVNVYDLRENAKFVQDVQHATLTSKESGILPEPALFGTAEWWDAVADGRVESHTVTGSVSDVRWESMGDWPGWTFRSDDGAESRWTREGDHTRYVKGLAARISFVVVSWKPESQLVRLGESPWHNMLIRVDLEDSPLRSAAHGRGPFGSPPIG
jgi:hypothetical protein